MNTKTITIMLSQLQRISLQHKLLLSVTFSTSCIEILNLLYKLNIIKFFYISNTPKKEIIIGLNKHCIKKIINFNKKKFNKSLSYIKIKKKFNNIPSQYTIFSTTRGLLLLDDIFFYKIGGYPLFQIII